MPDKSRISSRSDLSPSSSKGDRRISNSISIIMAVYNDRHNLRSTLLNICSQVSDSWELIVIDGGSTDGTQEVIREFTSVISYWVSEKDGEVPEVVYRGRIADGRIIPPPPARASRAAACVTMKLRAARAEPQPRRCPPGAPVQYSQREIAAGDLAIPQRKACGDLVRRPFIRPILNARRSASALTTRLSCSLLGSMSWDLMPLVDPMPSST